MNEENLRQLSAVIPGRAKREPGIHNHGSACMDSGLAPSGASRNDGECWALRRVVRLLAVEHAFQGIEMSLRRRRALVQAAAADVALGLFDHGGRKLLQFLPGPHRIDLNLPRA